MMDKKTISQGKNILRLMLFVLFIFNSFYCGDNDNPGTKRTPNKNVTGTKVTFIELGSVNCIPCKMMQPVMEAVEKEYGDQIKVIFYDVWKDPAYGKTYRIRLIPTQVFLDENGNEFFRHEGFFPQEEIDKLLTERGLAKIGKTESGKS